MANVQKQTSSSGKTFFKAVWSSYDASGKRKQHTKSFDKQADAKAYSRKMETEIEAAKIKSDKNLTVAVWIKQCLAEWTRTEKRTPATLDNYAYCLSFLEREMGNIEMTKVTPIMISKAFASIQKNGGHVNFQQRGKEGVKGRPLASSSMGVIFGVGKSCFEAACNLDVIAKNPFAKVEAPAEKKAPIKIMSDEQAMAVLKRAKIEQAKKQDGIDLAVSLLFCCGMRVSELLGLAFDALDFDKCTIKLTRTVVFDRASKAAILRDGVAKSERSLRTISFPADLIPMLKRHRAYINEQVMRWGRASYQTEPLLLFPVAGGGPNVPADFARRIKRIQRRVGVTGVKPTHVFRHSMASHLLAEGTDIQTVSTRLGHASAAFTLRTYIHTIDGTDQVAADQIGSRFSAMNKE